MASADDTMDTSGEGDGGGSSDQPFAGTAQATVSKSAQATLKKPSPSKKGRKSYKRVAKRTKVQAEDEFRAQQHEEEEVTEEAHQQVEEEDQEPAQQVQQQEQQVVKRVKVNPDPKNRGRNRASPSRLFKLNELLVDDQIELIEKYGFGGLTYVPREGQDCRGCKECEEDLEPPKQRAPNALCGKSRRQQHHQRNVQP